MRQTAPLNPQIFLTAAPCILTGEQRYTVVAKPERGAMTRRELLTMLLGVPLVALLLPEKPVQRPPIIHWGGPVPDTSHMPLADPNEVIIPHTKTADHIVIQIDHRIFDLARHRATRWPA